MPASFPGSPKLLKGALVELSEPFLGPVPNIIVFQYNPETLTRDLTPWSANGGGQSGEISATAQPFDPEESFRLTLELDATDGMEEPELHPVAAATGVADRIAALEMLLYPTNDPGSMLGKEFATFGGLLKKSKTALAKEKQGIPRGEVPVVLFIWGPQRIVPVRLRSFEVEEQAFSPALYPIRARVSIGLQVLTDRSFWQGAFAKEGKKTLSRSEDFAVGAYKFTRMQKEILARANQVNNVESILGMLPF